MNNPASGYRGSQDVDDPADNPAVISTMSAGLAGRRQR